MCAGASACAGAAVVEGSVLLGVTVLVLGYLFYALLAPERF